MLKHDRDQGSAAKATRKTLQKTGTNCRVERGENWPVPKYNKKLLQNKPKKMLKILTSILVYWDG